MSTISAGTTSTTALTSTGDTTGNLVLQVNGSTNAVSLNTSGAVGVGSSPSYGTAGQTLVSNGSAAAPSWGSSIVSGTAQSTTSGTAIDFTGIPSWVKRITVMFNGVSVTQTAMIVIQLGTASGVENTGYLGSGAGIGTSSAGGSVYTAGFRLSDVSSNTTTVGGLVTICNLSGNIWVAAGIVSDGNTTKTEFTSGYKTLAAQLDRIRITTTNGTDTFDAGSVNILYE